MNILVRGTTGLWLVLPTGANPDPAEEQQAQSESHGTQDALLR